MDETAVTIVAVIVAGVVGPGITAWITARLQRTRFEHERQLHDLDDLRRELDRMADAIATLAHTLTDLLKGAGDDVLLREAHGQARIVVERASRLQIRMGEKEMVVLTASRVATLMEGLIDDLGGLSIEEKRIRATEVREATSEFFRAASGLIGARVD